MNHGIGTRHGKAGIVFLFLLTFAVLVNGAEASPSYFTSFQSTYPSSPLSAVASNCSICHTSPPTRNSYGSAYASAGHNFAAIEGADSDGDGFTNIAEITAGTYPGNAASFPAGNVAGPMTVTPAGGLTSSGTAGGPFSPSSQIYTVTNTGTASMNWTATKVASWVTLSSAGGTLAAGANTTVTASINAGANSLAAGSYSDNVTFTNTSSGTGNTTRPVSLTVNATNVAGPMTVTPAGGLTSVGDGRRSVLPVEPDLHGHEHGHRLDELDGDEGGVVGDVVCRPAERWRRARTRR